MNSLEFVFQFKWCQTIYEMKHKISKLLVHHLIVKISLSNLLIKITVFYWLVKKKIMRKFYEKLLYYQKSIKCKSAWTDVKNECLKCIAIDKFKHEKKQRCKVKISPLILKLFINIWNRAAPFTILNNKIFSLIDCETWKWAL